MKQSQRIISIIIEPGVSDAGSPTVSQSLHIFCISPPRHFISIWQYYIKWRN